MAVMMAETEAAPGTDAEGNEQREPQIREDMIPACKVRPRHAM